MLSTWSDQSEDIKKGNPIQFFLLIFIRSKLAFEIKYIQKIIAALVGKHYL